MPIFLMPDIEGFVVLAVDGDPELSRVEPVIPGDEFPAEVDRVFFEIVAERKISQHLEKRVVPRGMAHVLEIVVLAADPHAFLAGGGAAVGALFVAEEDILELVHAGVGKQQRRIVEGDQGGAGNDLVTVALEELRKASRISLLLANSVSCVEMRCQLCGWDSSRRARPYIFFREAAARRCANSFRIPLRSEGSRPGRHAFRGIAPEPPPR